MRIELGPRDEKRFASVDKEEREYLAFLVDFTMGILEKRPNQFEALSSAATALTMLGYYQDGLRLDDRLASLSPDDPTVRYNLACSLALNQKIDEAFVALEQAIELGYSDVRHMKADPDLANIRSLPRFGELASLAQARVISP